MHRVRLSQAVASVDSICHRGLRASSPTRPARFSALPLLQAIHIPSMNLGRRAGVLAQPVHFPIPVASRGGARPPWATGADRPFGQGFDVVKRMPAKTASRHFEAFPGSELTPEQVEFGKAIDRYKRTNHRPYPSWDEILAVALSLGYRKVAESRPVRPPPVHSFEF